MAGGERERRALDLVEAALERPEADRETFVAAAAGEDHGLRDRVLSLLRAGEGGAFVRTGGAAAASAAEADWPERIGPWRITGLIGQGGMGAVLRAERAVGDFDQTVAIKLIRPGPLSDALVERFRRERQVLARLNHPGIARLYDGGETAAGQPYFVMELVEGEPLETWLARGPDRAARAALFLNVCRAVAYAHQNLVVHRDVTPANVLVQRDGTPKLIDFGIARPLGPEDEGQSGPVDAALAMLSLTPGYAAPERAGGGAATTLADVYSLGVLLGRVLPAESDADLAAIAAKATASSPEGRYASVDALADDLQAWRDGRPVGARAGGRRYVVGKFLRRHAAASAATAAGVVLLVGAAAVALLSAREADAARQVAEARDRETRRIAETLLFEAFDAVSAVPGATKAREVLAREGVRYLDALAAEKGAPAEVRVAAGRGYVRLAQVAGAGQGAQLGDFRSGAALLGKAETVLRRTLETHPDDPAARRALAELLIEQAGANLYNDNAYEKARAQAREARALLEPVAARDPDAARLYATAVQTEGDSYGWIDDYAKAEPLHREAERFVSGLPAALREEPGVVQARAGNLRLLAETLNRLDRLPDARAAMAEAVTLHERLLQASPSDPEQARRTAIARWYMAVLRIKADELEAAQADADRAVALLTALRDKDPADAGALRTFAVAGETRAQVLSLRGRRAEAERMSQAVIAAHREVVARSKNGAGARRSYAATLKILAGNAYNGGDYPTACRRWREAGAILDGLAREGKLSDGDRARMRPEIAGYVRGACENGPPRAGLGREV